MDAEANNLLVARLVSRAKAIALKLEERIRELLDDSQGPPSSAAVSDPSAVQFA